MCASEGVADTFGSAALFQFKKPAATPFFNVPSDCLHVGQPNALFVLTGSFGKYSSAPCLEEIINCTLVYMYGRRL